MVSKNTTAYFQFDSEFFQRPRYIEDISTSPILNLDLSKPHKNTSANSTFPLCYDKKILDMLSGNNSSPKDHHASSDENKRPLGHLDKEGYDSARSDESSSSESDDSKDM